MAGSQEATRGVSASQGELKLADVVAFFRRNFRLVVGSALLFGLVTAIVLLLVVRKKYEASATLVIVPPKLTSELKPGTLSVQSYQQILQSDAVLAETRKRLEQHGVHPDPKRFKIGQALDTRIFVSRLREDVALAPMLEIVARGRSPEDAALIANTWADVFLARTRELIAGTTSSSVQFVEQEFPRARVSLAKAEDQRVGEADALQKRFDAAASRWDEKIAAFKAETADLEAKNKSETTRLLEGFSSERNLATRREQLRALRNAYSDLQDEQARVNSALQQKQLQLAGLHKAMEKTPQFVSLQKAITNDALWRTVQDKGGNAPDWKALQDKTLISQELNPVYSDLASRAASTEADVAALGPRAAQLTERLDALSGQMKTMEIANSNDESGLQELKNTREASFTDLDEKRSAQLAVLNRERQQELDGLKREMDTRLGQLDRDIGQQKDLFGELSKSYNQALLAKGQQGFEDVRLGAPAVPPTTALPRGRLVKALIAAIIGGVLGIGVAMVREAWA
jgi:capsular polysaccharide biosynthesis protein